MKNIVIVGILVIGAAWYGYNRDLTIIKESASDRMHAMQEACREQGAEYMDMGFQFDSDGKEVFSLTCRMGVAR
jgi:hypothetical protein